MSKYLVFALIALCGFLPSSAQPTMTGARYRVVPFQGGSFAFVEVTLEFDTDLYFSNGAGGYQLLSSMNQTTPGMPPNSNPWPASMTYMQGLVQLSCGNVDLKMFGLGVPAGGNFFASTSSFVNIAFGLPNSAEALFTFMTYFERFALPFQPNDRQVSFAFLLDGQQFLVSGLDQASLDACTAAGTFKAMYLGSQASPNCGPTSAQITTLESGAPGYKYQSQLLGCQLFDSTGTAAAANQMQTIQLVPSRCSPVGAAGLTGDLKRVQQTFRGLQTQQEIDALTNILDLFTIRAAVLGCEQMIGSFATFGPTQVDLPESFACPYDYQTQMQQYLNDPCCAGSQYSCCAPHRATLTLQTIKGFHASRVAQQCTSANLQRVGNALNIFRQDKTEEQTQQSEQVDSYNLYNDLFRNVFDKCDREVQGQQWQSCNSDADCWSGVCRPQSGTCTSCPRYCASPASAVRALLRCLFAELKKEVVDELLNIQNITSSSAKDGISQLEAKLLSLYSQDDCEGPRSWSYKAQARWELSSSGQYKQVFTPVNTTACLAQKECNYGGYPMLNQSECEGFAARGLKSHFCKRCDGDWCRDVSEEPVCELQLKVTNATECALGGGTLRKPCQYCSVACVKPGDMSLYSSCLPSFCPGPNSPTSYINYQFNQVISNPNRRNSIWACSSAMCYSAQNQSACQASNSGGGPYRYWDRDYNDGNGLCKVYAWNGPSDCPPDMTYFGGVSYRNGVYDTQAKCVSPKCQLPREYELVEMSAANCRSQKGCSLPCTKCTINPWNGEKDGACTYPLNAQGRCDKGSAVYDSTLQAVSCYSKQVVNAANCVAQNGTWALCSAASDQATCGNGLNQAIGCYWNTDAPCTSHECLNTGKGECNDWDLVDYTTPTCQNGWRNGYVDCGSCNEPFKTLKNGETFPNCYTPLSASGYPNYTASNYGNMQRGSRIGCFTEGSPSNYNASSCAMNGKPNSKFATRAQNQAQCEAHGIGCRRRWGDVQMMRRSDCDNCRRQGARWGAFLYTWTPAQEVSGVPVALTWSPRAWVSVNRIVMNTVPSFWVRQLVEQAVTRIVALTSEAQLSRTYFGRAAVYTRLACLCSDPTKWSPAATKVCGKALNSSARAEQGECKCINGGTSCNSLCPFSCGEPCDFTLVNVFPEDTSGSARRRLQPLQVATGVPVRNTHGVIVGQTVGIGRAYPGQVPANYEVCMTKDPFININPAYTVPDIAKEVPGGGVGVPEGITVTVTGDQYCANVTTQDTFFPIVRLTAYSGAAVTATPTVSPTTTQPSGSPSAATSPSVAPVAGGGAGPTPTTSPTKPGKVNSGAYGLGRSGLFVVLGIMAAFYF